jgi:hypothetical protein
MFAVQQTPGLIQPCADCTQRIDVAVESDAEGGFTVGISKKPASLAAIRHFASEELSLISDWLESKARDLYQLEQPSDDAIRQPSRRPQCVQSIMADSMSHTTHLMRARRHVAEPEVRVAAQRMRVSKLAAAGHGWPEAGNLLLVFEKVLSTMRTHLALEESRVWPQSQ